MRRILLALALVAMATTAASAETYVWWTLAGSNCEATAIEYGNGHTLVIEKPLVAPAGYYEFELTMWIGSNGTGGTNSGVTAHRNVLWRGPDTTLQMTSDAMTGLLNPLGWTGSVGFTAGSQNNGDKLIDNWGRARAAGQQVIGGDGANDNLAMISMTLKIDAAEEEFCDWHYIYQSVGSSQYGWAPITPATNNQVFFGPNAFQYGNYVPSNVPKTWADASLLAPVIAIHAVPEPATLALLGFGFLALLRRR